ncbi:PKD domain-containing protein [Fluviicola sp.]|uniref:PKD domain-containing protein n=1 Tax=Fluviicola sp. TaxID=1917219 RepID=UPI0026027806|nr:PKD domain-containing protein [Fluviicola sp.]
MNWRFGFGAGLNFSSGNPVPFNGAMTAIESCASISDSNGNLLFYTNGVDVWNANNLVMPNGSGLLGHKSSQCIIIPRPGNPGKYYIVTTDAIERECMYGITYSEVDMNLLNGSGDVTTLKNVQLNAPNGEWVTAVRHANCVDTWIITHGKHPNNLFLAYQVSSSGINPTPVATDLGISVQPNLMAVGIMKPNPEGTKIAMSRPYAGGSIELIDFDKATGIATGMSNLFTGTATGNGFGMAFSRSGNRLYVGEFGNTEGGVFQFDMTAANITASRIRVSPPLSFPGEVGYLQIAPNDKIYINYNAYPSADFIGAITNPELPGLACGFVENAVSLGATAIYGLPWYYDPEFLQPSPLDLGPDLQLCPESTMTLSNNLSNVPGANYLWSDGSTNPTLPVSETGTFWLQYQIESCLPSTDSITITFDTTQISHTIGDTSGCAPFTVHVTGIGPADISGWMWDMGNGDIVQTQNAAFTYTSPGIYTVSLTAISSNNCLIRDSIPILVEAFPVPTADFSYLPTAVKPNIPIQFTDQSTGNIVSWSWQINDQPVSTTPGCTYTLQDYIPLIVSLTVTNSDGCTDERKVIVFKPADLVYVPNTFTPDGNELNNIFKPVDYFGLVSEFAIYNRWGQLIWSGTSAADGWNGLVDGKLAAEGVYTWWITLTVDDIPSKQIQGHVTLLR